MVRLFSASMGSVLDIRFGRVVDGLARLVAGTGRLTSLAAVLSTLVLASGTGLRAPCGAVSGATVRTVPGRFRFTGSVRANLEAFASVNLGRYAVSDLPSEASLSPRTPRPSILLVSRTSTL